MPDLNPLKPGNDGKYEIGQLKRVSVTCVSEIGWFDDGKMIGQVLGAGGMDTDWNPQYMNECFKRSGIDKMLRDGQIEFLFITHEHMDHFYGLEPEDIVSSSTIPSPSCRWLIMR